MVMGDRETLDLAVYHRRKRQGADRNMQPELILALLVSFSLGYLLPRVSAYFLGPALLGLTAMAFVWAHDLFFGGSVAGLVAWPAAIMACGGGIVLIATGLIRVWLQHRSTQRPPAADLAQSSNERASWRLFNAALGIATLIAPVQPLGGLMGRFSYTIIGSAGLPAWELVQFLDTYLLPAGVLFLGLRLSGMRQFASSNRGAIPILVGGAVIWFLYPDYVIATYTAARRLAYIAPYSIELLRVLIWSARAAIVMGLFLRWRAHFRTPQATGALPDA